VLTPIDTLLGTVCHNQDQFTIKHTNPMKTCLNSCIMFYIDGCPLYYPNPGIESQLRVQVIDVHKVLSKTEHTGRIFYTRLV